MAKPSSDIWLLFYRYGGKGRWRRIVGPMWVSKDDAENNITQNVSPSIEYKAVRYVMVADEFDVAVMDIDPEPSLLDPRIPSSLSVIEGENV